jgi:hypothetical protein
MHWCLLVGTQMQVLLECSMCTAIRDVRLLCQFSNTNIVTCLLRAWIVKPAQTTPARSGSVNTLVARQWLSSRHVKARNRHACNNRRAVGSDVFCAVRPRLYNERELSCGDGVRHPCGGGVEYLHRDPASRRRRRKGKSQIWNSKMCSQVPRDYARERLRWLGPAARTKDRPVLSSERASHGIKNVTVRRIPYSERKKIWS